MERSTHDKAVIRARQMRLRRPVTQQGHQAMLALSMINYALSDVEHAARNWGNYEYVLATLQRASEYMQKLENLIMELELAQ